MKYENAAEYGHLYNDNLARRPERKSAPQRAPEIQSAPKKGIRTRPAQRLKSQIKPVWLLSFAGVGLLYIMLIYNYMSLTELSVQASEYTQTITYCQEEIEKMAKVSSAGVEDSELSAFIDNYDMTEAGNADIEYLNAAAGDEMVSLAGNKNSGTGEIMTKIEEKLGNIIEFFR